LEIEPEYPVALNNLAWVLATSADDALRDGGKAVDLAEKANRLTGGNNAQFLVTLAAAYAEAGRLAEAVQTANRALQLAEASADNALVKLLRTHLQLYQSGSPLQKPQR
jgi:tetratricopeptide (TPR) repeat protein